MTPTELTNALRHFTGTERYLRYSILFPDVLLTDGARFLADEAGAYWLMDMIASHLPTLKSNESFLIARYAGTPGASGLFSLTDDIPANETYAMQAVEYSDFPLDEIKLYVGRADEKTWVIMLPSEY